jgi:hypothetical protein
VTDFVIGEALHKTKEEVKAMPNSEIVEWLAFFTYRKAKLEQERQDG